jgi:hypothetical protein
MAHAEAKRGGKFVLVTKAFHEQTVQQDLSKRILDSYY